MVETTVRKIVYHASLMKILPNKPIFNSLGSNYSLGYALLALKQLVWPNKLYLSLVKQKLTKIFQLDSTLAQQLKLVYKGRDAIEVALKSFAIGAGNIVLTQAFCCSSIEEAVQRTQAKVEYLDLGSNQVGLSITALETTLARKPQVKALIVQNIFGYSQAWSKIKQICQKHQVLLIQDLAQALGAVGKEQKIRSQEAADVIILSFGRDKIADAIAGGGIIFIKQPLKSVKIPGCYQLKTQIIKDMFYPGLTWLIRNTYLIGLGKLIHYLAKKSQLLTSPVISQTSQACRLPVYYAQLILHSLNKLDQELNHRQKIAQIYFSSLEGVPGLEILVQPNQIQTGANLRFPVATNRISQLLQFLQTQQIYLTDRWYKAPVDCGSHQCQTSYQAGSCPKAEQLAKKIINLPTHRQIKPAKAQQITKLLKQFFQKNE